MKRIAITGGRGYIGSALVKRLERRNDLIVCAIDNHPLRGCSTLPYQEIEDWGSFSVIIHLAAHSNVKACNDAPAAAWENNVTGFEGLLRKVGEGQKLIYASTAGVYHNRQEGANVADLLAPLEGYHRWEEDHVLSRETDILAPPYMLYDLTKRTMDDLARLSGKDCYSLRFGTLAGPSPVMRHDPVVNAMVRSAVTSNTIHVQNPYAPRAVLGIGDCVRAIEKVMDAGVAAGVYNVASFNTTIMEIAETVARLTGARIQLEGDTPHYEFKMDTSLSQRTFGIAYTDTLEGLCEALLQEAVVV